MTTSKARKERGHNIKKDEARRILNRHKTGAKIDELAAEFSRAPSSILRVLKNPGLYLMTHSERLRKGTPIPMSAGDKRARSLREPSPRRPDPVAQPPAQISDSQVSFEFAVALLEKATQLVRVLGQQQRPPELVAMVRETIQAAVRMEMDQRVAQEMAELRQVEEEAEARAKEAAQRNRYPLGGHMMRNEAHLVNKDGEPLGD